VRSTPRITICGDTQLPGSISDLEHAIFVRIEGMGGVTGSPPRVIRRFRDALSNFSASQGLVAVW
jgi:hypothetical protein